VRHTITLQRNWWVSISPHDAKLAARQENFAPEALELAADAENHPLPAGIL